MGGKLIAIEGIDGAGKGTVTMALAERLRGAANTRLGESLTVETVSFPQYANSRFGKLIGKYLNGDFGTLSGVHPYLSSLLFAGDRREYRWTLQQDLLNNDFVIADRYVLSNVAYHAAKAVKAAGRAESDFAAATEMRDHLLWLEHELNELPRPWATILLNIDIEVAAANVLKKQQRLYTDKQKDIHEADQQFMQEVASQYLALSELPLRIIEIEVSDGGQMRPVNMIVDEICIKLLQLAN